MYTCPVCDWHGLEDDPLRATYDICPRCGTEFGYHDANRSHAELRQEWLDAGAKWWANDTPDDGQPIPLPYSPVRPKRVFKTLVRFVHRGRGKANRYREVAQ